MQQNISFLLCPWTLDLFVTTVRILEISVLKDSTEISIVATNSALVNHAMISYDHDKILKCQI